MYGRAVPVTVQGTQIAAGLGVPNAKRSIPAGDEKTSVGGKGNGFKGGVRTGFG